MQTRSLADVLRQPLVVAPMGGGPSTSELVIAAAEAGALGFLAAGYKTTAAMTAEIVEVRATTSEPFGVNVFVPGDPSQDAQGVARYLESLDGDAQAVDAPLGEPTWDDDAFQDKIAALLADPPPVVSFAFGCPDPEVISALGDAGAVVAVTVTNPQEAVVAVAAGAAALCVQGHEAGAHRGTFTNDGAPGGDYGLLSLIGEVTRVTDLPQMAAGGIMGPEQVTAVLEAGAVAAQCGTAFLRCPESGAHPLHKAALVDPRYTSTVLTRAFSGRPARGLVNQFVLDHADAPAAYPEINNATRPMRAAAAAKHDVGRMSLWAGQGFPFGMRPSGRGDRGEVVRIHTLDRLKERERPKPPRHVIRERSRAPQEVEDPSTETTEPASRRVPQRRDCIMGVMLRRTPGVQEFPFGTRGRSLPPFASRYRHREADGRAVTTVAAGRPSEDPCIAAEMACKEWTELAAKVAEWAAAGPLLGSAAQTALSEAILFHYRILVKFCCASWKVGSRRGGGFRRSTASCFST